ncbi:LOW QUALITY PROTEIN: unconventional myosin-VIIb-like [Cottoperca gobio]|uniref:LOW QUALITY PROTEIN: unconventional myosin-VIIb-like n=1 Tax=Cottoperca gobio TaxID=56716 RepID=A0A6J2RIT6_COTGO|nr:LOW QUALITY PROTEIN: unconventional myosin-VIIb-like [Cottoperca gobio]
MKIADKRTVRKTTSYFSGVGTLRIGDAEKGKAEKLDFIDKKTVYQETQLFLDAASQFPTVKEKLGCINISIVLYFQGEWVWVDSNIGVPIGARVKVTPSGQRLLVDDEGKEKSLSQEQEASLRIMHPTSVEGVDDMIKLGDMTEAGLLRNLLLRHKRGKIYTYTGAVLVAVNPYKNFPLYSVDQVELYHGRKLGELPPHIFAIAESCYCNMRRHLRNQCCIISGESGAGKTESTKLILQYLAAISGELSEQKIEQQILESNPILEAFGNAKTIRNDNSSRFGKYLEIFFNKDGVIEGARVEQYLLEKSRVCHQALEERNYHVFYCMLAGATAEEKKALNLGDAMEYKFLSKGGCFSCEGRDDAKDYTRIRSAMKILTFSESQCQEILKLLAAILHLGNVCFQANTQNNMETSNVSKSEHFSIAAAILEVKKSSLAESLTHRSFMTNRERVIKPLSSEQASDCRDAFVKAIYNKLFIWIVGKINSVIYKKLTKIPKSSFLSIGLLDIFGFENFQTNSFEQLCINFANEKLQQFFVGHIFKLEQKEYLKEDIVWNNMKFSDNQSILDVLAVKPCNLLALIDEESHFPKGSDITMLNKMNQQHRGNKTYIASKSEHDTDFGICHFAGSVHYDSKGFLEKNRDAVSFDMIKMVEKTTNKQLRQIFETELSTNGVKISNNKKIIITPNTSLRAQSDSRKQVATLSAQFRQSLDSLMKALSACQPFFIRCFKPNNEKQSEVFDRELCIRQLRYSGMIDTIRIRKLGYPIRHTFGDFLQRYRVLLKTTVCDPKTESAAACCEAICKAVIEGANEWKIGRTKIFLRDAHDAVLERLREEKLNRIALVIQRVMLVHKDRKSFLKKRKAAVVLQKHWRAYRQEKLRRKLLLGFERLASKIRSRRLRLHFQRQQAAALTIQSQVRGYRARKVCKQKREAVILLQAHRRGILARRITQKMKEEAYLLRQEKENQDRIALELQQRLNAITKLRPAAEEPEPEEDTYDIQLPPPVEDIEEKASNEFEMRRNLPEPVEETSVETSEEIIAPASISTTPIPSLDEDEDEDGFDDGNDEFSFYKFSILHFQSNHGHTHHNQRLKQPLLPHDDEGDVLACLTVWWIILRFMEDIPEPKSADMLSQESSTISRHLPLRQGRRLSHLVGLDQIILRKNKKKFGAGNRKASVIAEEPEDFNDDGNVLIGEGPTLDRPLSSTEKLNIIIGYALSRPDIKDEIYCQICKQLVNNKKRKSHMHGWTLLSICLGIFPPTGLFMKYLESFINKGPSDYGAYCAERLRRIVANGERKELPCWTEQQAAKSKEPIDVSVTLMDGRTISVHMDSASTSAEVCQSVANKINLQDTYGFSLYISLFEKMWSLGNSGKHVLDAVSQCEQEMRRQGKQEKDTPWTLSIRKELFTPWHDSSIDPISTDLIYRQVIKGIKIRDYISETEDEYVQLAAKHYYIQFGAAYNRDNVHQVVEECIATPLIENKSMTKWIELISDAHQQGPYVNGKQKKDSVKGELVRNAQHAWPLHFSKFFEATMMSGPPLPKSMFVVAVNWNGIFFMDGSDKRLLELPYIEVKKVRMIRDSHLSVQSVSLVTVRGEFILKSGEAADMFALIERNLEGLIQRSVYALARQDANKPEDPSFLVCKQWDLLMAEKDEERSPDKNWFKATNQRTSVRGAVYKDTVQFLPTLEKPSDDMLELLTPNRRKPLAAQSATPRTETVAPVSIKEFAVDNFRPAGRLGASKGVGREKLWACSKEPLKQPLMKSLVGDSDLSNLACIAFTAILKYMGDYPIKHARTPIELTDQIFGPATQHEVLQDEIYCQIMRQMTNNNNRLSMERGWQLMWLCSGLFSPSHNLMGHTQHFLESRRRDLLSPGCLQRLHRMRSKEPRKLPPHQVEVDAIQQNSMQIFHNVHFPNDTSDIFEVKSTTTIEDLCCTIASHLKLSSAEGYGLSLKTTNKVISLEAQNYLFDSVRQTSEPPKKGKKMKEGNQTSAPYLVIFKRKLWFNVSPGKDLVADLTFHFPQELPRYLRGYHKCTKEDMTNLGGLLFREKVDSDRSQFVMIPKMLRELVPADQIKSMSPEEWKKHIISAYNKQSGITVQEAKIAFLKGISSWPTFGCAFFEVKQTCEYSYPSKVLIAISKQGVSLIDPNTKELLVMHPFSRITEYQSEGSYFEMSIGNLVRGNVFVCETSQASIIEDLLRSYINMYEKQLQAFRPRNHMFS